MKITATIDTVLPEESGVSKNGNPWRKRTYVCTYDNSNPKYPKRIVFQAMNDSIDKLCIQQGLAYDLELDFEAREYNGKWYMNTSCWKATLAQTVPQPAPVGATMPLAAYGQPPMPQPYAYPQQPPMQTATPQAPYGYPAQQVQQQPQMPQQGGIPGLPVSQPAYAQPAPQPQPQQQQDNDLPF